jgi:hypothetical protein
VTEILPLLTAARKDLPKNPTYRDIRTAARRFADGDHVLYAYLVEELLRLNPDVALQVQEVTDKFQSIDWKQLMSGDHDAHWLLEPVLPKGRLVALFAAGKAGKSLFALDMALALATGRGMLKQLPGEPVTVMYIDQEMTIRDLKERVPELGYDPDVDDLSRLVYYQLQGFGPLDTAKGPKSSSNS